MMNNKEISQEAKSFSIPSSSDGPSDFGGLCYDDTGAFLKTFPWRDDGVFQTTATIVPHVLQFIAHKQTIGHYAASVGKLRYSAQATPAVVSGWTTQSNDGSRYFISSAHAHSGSLIATVNFSSSWKGMSNLVVLLFTI